MKYSDGFWMNKSGYDVNYATQIYEVKATDNSITVYATNQWIGNRGMTLGGPVLEITFTSTLADSIKVTIEHYKGAVKKGPDFTLYEDANFKPVINEKDEYWELVSNKTSVRIGKAGGEHGISSISMTESCSQRKAGEQLLISKNSPGSQTTVWKAQRRSVSTHTHLQTSLQESERCSTSP